MERQGIRQYSLIFTKVFEKDGEYAILYYNFVFYKIYLYRIDKYNTRFEFKWSNKKMTCRVKNNNIDMGLIVELFLDSV